MYMKFILSLEIKSGSNTYKTSCTILKTYMLRWHVSVNLISLHTMFRQFNHDMPILVILIRDYPNPVDDQQIGFHTYLNLYFG